MRNENCFLCDISLGVEDDDEYEAELAAAMAEAEREWGDLEGVECAILCLKCADIFDNEVDGSAN